MSDRAVGWGPDCHCVFLHCSSVFELYGNLLSHRAIDRCICQNGSGLFSPLLPHCICVTLYEYVCVSTLSSNLHKTNLSLWVLNFFFLSDQSNFCISKRNSFPKYNSFSDAHIYIHSQKCTYMNLNTHMIKAKMSL